MTGEVRRLLISRLKKSVEANFKNETTMKVGTEKTWLQIWAL